jgi:PadR family transcriptional regulator, regulatory protein PadR
MPASELDLVRGTLDLLILRTVSWEPMHGLAISRWIDDVTKEKLQVEEGALYPALHRLEKRGFLESQWGMSDRNRKAKFYAITPRGRAHLKSELSRWERYTAAVRMVIAAEGGR